MGESENLVSEAQRPEQPRPWGVEAGAAPRPSPSCERPARLDFDVVIATRNRPQALELSIPLILGQSRQPKKLIVIDSSDDQTRVALAQDQSPDLTHVRLIKEGQDLPSLCNEVYGDPQLYVEVARANRLDNFRSLKPGTKVFFPPLQK